MRTRRLLLAASALSTLAFGCSKGKPADNTDRGTTEPLPGNPKGTFYDDAMVKPMDPGPVAADANTPDAGVPDAAPNDATRDAPRDAAVAKPRDAAVRPLPGNPKGSRYDAGTDPDL